MENKFTCCGCDCSKLPCYKKECKGCEEECGKVFWLKYTNLSVCPIYECIKEKGYKSCLECSESPCHRYFDIRDPRMSEEEHNKYVRQQMENLKSLGDNEI
ncbi:MAG: DUF3795 domain-containing protein [Paludibacteraceae bacterium]|nr:DUF3795 domain-containing protein [Prevotellaceae bacterium]